jgi:hypothetical protein
MILHVGNDLLDEKWPVASKLLEPVLKDVDPGRVKAFIREGIYQLWLVDDKAACTTAINDFPVGKVLTVVHLAGKGLEEWMFEGISILEHWGKSQGCDRIRINGRDEWSRVLPGYSKSAVVSEKVLQ